MSNLLFWQTAGAVITGNALCGLTIYMVWRVTKAERKVMPPAPAWLYFVGALAPLVVAFSAYMLP